MPGILKNNNCKNLRHRLADLFEDRFSLDTPWIQRHLADCPRCRQRLTGFGRVSLALTFIKSQPHDLSLLSRANSQALNQLKHSLRNCPRAQKLKNARPDTSFFRRLIQYSRSGCSAAACLAIMLLVRFGVIDSLDNCHSEGQKVMKNYYAQHLGEDLADDLFQT